MKHCFFSFLGSLLFLFGFNTWAYTPEDCITCHKRGSTESIRNINIKEFDASVHGRQITCLDCHERIENKSHETMTQSGTVDCVKCHEQENQHGFRSRPNDRPKCHACHTRHRILEKEDMASSVHSKRLKETCKACHPVECGETDYLSWLPSIRIASHNKQDFGRSYDKGNCIGCHQGEAAHGEKGIINDQDCYRCHFTPDGQSRVFGYIHLRADFKEQPVVFGAATIYQIFIAVLLLFGFRFFIRKFFGKG